jgi:hypothetical protein
MPTHEIPTHLHSADRVVAGCTWSQLFTLGGGAAVAFWGWHTGALPQVARFGLCALPMLAALACAFWRPGGHGLLAWLGLAATYMVRPHHIVWRRVAPNLPLLSPPAVRVCGSTVPAADGLAGMHITKQARSVFACVNWPVFLAMRHGRAPRAPVAVTCTSRATHRAQPTQVAQRHDSPWTPLLGYRLLCLATHHTDSAPGEHDR